MPGTARSRCGRSRTTQAYDALPRLEVPKGRLRIAHQFTGGNGAHKRCDLVPKGRLTGCEEPVPEPGDLATGYALRTVQPSLRDLVEHAIGFPALKRWAIVIRPFGTEERCIMAQTLKTSDEWREVLLLRSEFLRIQLQGCAPGHTLHSCCGRGSRYGQQWPCWCMVCQDGSPARAACASSSPSRPIRTAPNCTRTVQSYHPTSVAGDS